ncbi:MAG: universal stress protein [Magnetospirillum sp.]
MSVKNILVHLDSSARCAERLRLGVALAARSGARLVGVFAQMATGRHVGVLATWPSEEYRIQSENSRADFQLATRELAQAEWLDLNRGGEAEVTNRLILLARHYDLVVLGQRDPQHAAPLPADLCEDVIMESGRPVLVVPYAGHYDVIGRRPLIAWHDAPSAARALNDSLALVEPQAHAMVVSIAHKATADHDSVDQILAHLETHHVTAEADHLVVEDEGVMDALLNRAADHGADLLAMGASGGHGLAFLGRGSGTRYILRHMTLPVLLSH